MQQAAAIPFRRRKGKLEIALVTSSGSGRWVIPKGIVDPGESAKKTARRETAEEAGLHGEITGKAVGSYDYAKWGTTLTVDVFLLEVEREEKDWDERPFRDRCWVKAKEARRLLAEHPAAELIAKAISKLE